MVQKSELSHPHIERLRPLPLSYFSMEQARDNASLSQLPTRCTESQSVPCRYFRPEWVPQDQREALT